MSDTQTPRTKAKIKENLGLLLEYFRKRYGSTDEEVEQMLFNALDWTANDVVQQPHPELGSGAMREALEQIASITCSCHDSADANWHGKRCPKGIALSALSLSSPIEALTVEEVVACLWTRSDGSPDPAATTSRLNNLLRNRPSRQGAAKRVEG